MQATIREGKARPAFADLALMIIDHDLRPRRLAPGMKMIRYVE